jgi:hypothetical protein
LANGEHCPHVEGLNEDAKKLLQSAANPQGE